MNNKAKKEKVPQLSLSRTRELAYKLRHFFKTGYGITPE
jgi:hypothetical protein